MNKFDFYPEINPYNSFMLKVSDIHSIYVEECGNPNGEPIVFLHGGPGGRIMPKARRFFDPDFYRIILFDQRGTGNSEPFISLEENNIFFLIEDMEKIRKHLNIDKWHIFGGSFGSTLALVYSINFPERVKSMVLRGIFLGRQEDIDWLYQNGASYFYPEKFEIFKNHIEKDKQNNLIEAYYEKLTSSDKETMKKAAKIWSNWESGVVELISTFVPTNDINSSDISLAVLECHYFKNKMSWSDDNYIINNAKKIKKIPTYIVHGRYDVDCRVSGAYELAKNLENCKLEIIEAAGHTPYSDNMKSKLIEFLEEIKIGVK
ncbi:prolyl aminopeptidase [Fusobacterium gastrosuis]|uniref:prolyl aminopeptidase n=1 Tax=Fusobacterium gastrosuis TaxID=1755100 RepID=UPI002A9425A3|nr:prolyl aminopeptidase [Fusobacterium gastrosuis]